MWDIIAWLVLGAVAGWLASIVMKTNAQMGMLANIVVGIIGAFIGGWVLGLLGFQVQDGQLNLPSLLSAVLGAVILIGLLKLLSGRK